MKAPCIYCSGTRRILKPHTIRAGERVVTECECVRPRALEIKRTDPPYMLISSYTVCSQSTPKPAKKYRHKTYL